MKNATKLKKVKNAKGGNAPSN